MYDPHERLATYDEAQAVAYMSRKAAHYPGNWIWTIWALSRRHWLLPLGVAAAIALLYIYISELPHTTQSFLIAGALGILAVAPSLVVARYCGTRAATWDQRKLREDELPLAPQSLAALKMRYEKVGGVRCELRRHPGAPILATIVWLAVCDKPADPEGEWRYRAIEPTPKL